MAFTITQLEKQLADAEAACARLNQDTGAVVRAVVEGVREDLVAALAAARRQQAALYATRRTFYVAEGGRA